MNNNETLLELLDLYSEGKNIKLLAYELNIEEEEILKMLISYRDTQKVKRSYTDEFKKIIANRDSNGVARNVISKELNINPATVKKACEMFGNSKKSSPSLNEKATLTNYQPEDLVSCPNCLSKKINSVHSIFGSWQTEGIFCLDCGDEYFVLTNDSEEIEDYQEEEQEKMVKVAGVYKVNFEYWED